MTCRARAYKHTHKHTYSEETEESLFYFSVVLFHILLGSKIGGFQLYHQVHILPAKLQNRMPDKGNRHTLFINLFAFMPQGGRAHRQRNIGVVGLCGCVGAS